MKFDFESKGWDNNYLGMFTGLCNWPGTWTRLRNMAACEKETAKIDLNLGTVQSGLAKMVKAGLRAGSHDDAGEGWLAPSGAYGTGRGTGESMEPVKHELPHRPPLKSPERHNDTTWKHPYLTCLPTAYHACRGRLLLGSIQPKEDATWTRSG